MAKDDYGVESYDRQIRLIIDDEFDQHGRAQATWPETTDCDRLDLAFEELNRSGIVARQNFSCCGTCAAGEIREVMDELIAECIVVRGYTSYDFQSTESAVGGDGIALNYGSTEDAEAPALRIGHEIVATLVRHGLHAQWDGTWDRRIIVKLDLKRRQKPTDVVRQPPL